LIEARGALPVVWCIPCQRGGLLLEFDSEPGFLERYAIRSFDAFQALGQFGVLVLYLHPRQFRTEVELATHVGLQEMLGEEINCSIGDWRFVGVIDKVETNTQAQIFKLTARDGLAKLDNEFGSRVFSESTVDDVVSALMPSGQGHECVGDIGSQQTRLAIQYQETNYAFLKRFLSSVGAQVWCAGDTIYVGNATTSDSFTQRLGRDISNFTVETRLGPESVSVDSVPYASNNSIEQSQHNLANEQYGPVQDDVISRRSDTQTESTLHVTHEDSSYDDTAQMAQRFLRSRAGGRFSLTGHSTQPVTLGASLAIENYDTEAEEVTDTEQTVVTRISLHGERADDVHLWSIRAENPQALLRQDEPQADRVMKAAAIVDDVDDPLNTNRVKVYFPWDGNEASTPWLRVATPYWGDDHAHFLPPKLGDTVMVTWGQSDTDPVIVGALPSGQELDLNDQTFALKTADGQKITIGEDNIKLLNEAGGGGSSIEILGDQLVITASNGQTATVGSDSIVLDNGSGCTIELTSSGITVSGTMVEISNSAGASIALNGPTVSINNGALDIT
jgi:uncharacterized protein involved in type VI secretion and phage assembly